uniref:Uncharacterized protein n=1 Tax=Anopheles culicifacies TaxID=139723 RepID=A0A182MEK4_9DIPT
MGRKVHLERPKKGPGRKARKQAEPVFQFSKDEDEDTNKKLSRHQKQRLKKREITKQKQKEVQKVKKSVQNVKKASGPNTFDPSEILNVEKTRQKYQQLGQKNKALSVTSNGHQNGGEKGRNLFDSDNEMDEDQQQVSAATKSKVLVKKSQMKKFLQQGESDDETDSDEDDVDSDVEEEEEEDEEADSVDDEEVEDEEDADEME